MQRVQHRLRTSLLQALFDRVLGLKDFRKLLKGPILGLWEVEIHDQKFDKIPGDEHQVEIVSDRGETWTNTIVRYSTRSIGAEISKSCALGASFRRECLGDICTRLACQALYNSV